MNLRSLNSSSMQGASFDREIASGFARKAISQDGEAVRSDSSAVAVDDAQVARTTSAPVVLRVGFKAGKMTAGKHGEDPEVSEAVRCLQKSRLGYRFVKRAFDIVFSAFVLIAFSWLFAIVAIAIEIDDRGPVIFKQSASGRTAKSSTCISSAACAWTRSPKARRAARAQRRPARCSKSPLTRASRAWGRVTRSRSTNCLSPIDELPQFANVLKGDIPLRILKTRPGSLRNPWVRSRSAKSSTNKGRCFRRSRVVLRTACGCVASLNSIVTASVAWKSISCKTRFRGGVRIVARKVLALAFRNAIASPGANPGRAVACASGLEEDRLIDIRNDEGAGSPCECNSAIGCYMSTKNSNCVERCAPNGAYKAPAPDSSVAAPKKGGVGYLVAKRVFDIAFSAGVCLVLAVPVAVACAAICVDTPGKPFFRQERIGQGGKKIYIFKLRTMVSDAHDHPERYMSSAQLETWRREQKLDDDPRITRVGRILRRTSLDELPQFLNVLSGDLSVIGPRPVTLQETYEYGDAREEVLSCKPGITGWWAVTDRNNSTWQSGQRQARELFYVRHQSFGLDARVFVKTFKAMRRGK